MRPPLPGSAGSLGGGSSLLRASASTAEIRRRFLEYFEGHGHLRLPSASLVPLEDDPSVLLTIAGMQPLKGCFLGRAAPPAPRMTSSQKCFRTNDIDQVGHTARHLTFFEMLGNFSIGDYFKDDAIRFAYELSTEVYGLDPERIWITVFEGMEGVPPDEEAEERWVALGIPPERIQRLGDPENFWRAGPTGPCGPNTELYLDRGEAFGPPGGPAAGGDRYLEFWNLVFMQYDRAEDGTLSPLPARNIDTGAGLERLAALLQDVPSVFETDAFRPLVAWAESASGRPYGASPRDDRALRVLADHGRAMTFLASDGVRPGNEGRDYILRRIVRRAVSEAGQLGLPPESVVDLTRPVVDGFGDAYPELRAQAGTVADVVGAEAEQFARTLAAGRVLLGEVIERSRPTGVVAGDDAFRLYDTYGFPLDLTLEAAADAGLAADTAGFERLMEGQRERSRAGGRDGALAERGADLAAVLGQATPARFVGYDTLSVSTRVSALRALPDGESLLVLERSPFYAQGGGQVSDAGALAGDGVAADVLEVLRAGDGQALRVRVREGRLEPGTPVEARVPAGPRHATEANHTATHLLNWALRERLGADVRQAGSYVGPDKLRFDFTHRGPVPAEELERIEAMVNARVAEDDPVDARVMGRADADALGAIGLFEEKYGERVRVVSAGDYSRELCGGTHVGRTGEIGPFKILSEAGTGAGARRIEAVTGQGTLTWYRERERGLLADLDARDERIRSLEAALRAARAGAVDVPALAARAVSMGPEGRVRALVAQVEAADMDELLALSDRLKRSLGAGAAVVLGAAGEGKAQLVANLSPEAVADGLSAAALMKEMAPRVGGGGGGKDAMARAGGRDPAGLPGALAAGEEAIRAALAPRA